MARPRIVIIDDERDLVEAMKIRLEHHGFEVCAYYDAGTGMEAVRTVSFTRECPATREATPRRPSGLPG